MLKLRSELRRPHIGLTFQRDTVLKWLAILVLVAGAGFALRVFIKNRVISSEQKVLALFLKKMEKKGYHKKASQGLEEFISSINNEETKARALHFICSFQKLYYRDIPFQAENTSKLKEIIKSI